MKNKHLEDLMVAIVQPNIIWENKEENLSHLTRHIDVLIEEHPVVDLIVLPEMFSTGFTMNPQPHAETMDGPTIEWMKEISSENDLAICGSLIVEENSHIYNRFVFIQPHAEIVYYDKKHLFSYAGENKAFTAGNSRINILFKGWSINPFICYDLRFPVWCRNNNGADIMIFVANWPETRIVHWKNLLLARAIENQCYVIGANRVGEDNNNLVYNGQSCAVDPMGNILVNMEALDGFKLCHFQKSQISGTRDKLPFLKDIDQFYLG